MFLINIWASIKGTTNDGDNGFEYPYKAMSPVDGKYKLFESKKDIYKELEMCYDELVEKKIKDIGETLYIEHFYFANTFDLLDVKYQNIIKKYNYSKSFNIPPYPSIQQTPASIIDDFIIIDNEMKKIKMKDKH